MKYCHNRGCKSFNVAVSNEEAYCSKRGNPLSAEDKQVPYVGKDPDTGIYRITFPPVEAEFSHDDAAGDAARHSGWGQDREFGEPTIEKVRSTVPIEEYPYICDNCKNCVHTEQTGRCTDCGEENWVTRK
ncbi:hypothetical protein HOL46_05015 [Candidatus Falkowbacteria bacterium]|nr:hypothetical protein [Candidatus Falkowbacteria bacterium]